MSNVEIAQMQTSVYAQSVEYEIARTEEALARSSHVIHSVTD